MKKIAFILLIIFSVSLIYAQNVDNCELGNSKIKIKIDNDFNSSLYIKNNKWEKIVVAEPFISLLDEKSSEIKIFSLKNFQLKKEIDSEFGKSDCLVVTAISDNRSIELKCEIYLPNEFNNSFIIFTSLNNLSNDEIKLNGFELAKFLLNAKDFEADSSYKFWSFQGGSYQQRFDWIFPLTKNFRRQNYQGMNAPDYGGGMPIVDLWTESNGIAFASLSKTPELISLPVAVEKKGVEVKIKKDDEIIIKPQEKYNLIPIAIIAHNGDYYNALNTYSNLMQKRGIEFSKAPNSAYEPEWCAWGYERNFNKEQILNSLGEVKKLGLNWVTIDDGWQNADGDWEIDRSKFPGGDKEFKALIDTIHSKGFKVRLWWVPLEAQDSSFNVTHFPDRMNEYGMKFQSSLALNHPNWFILDENGNRIQVSWWNSYYLCPASPEVKEYYKHFVEKAINNWGIDGFKIDGQNLNEVPQCYNDLHNHLNPEASSKSVPEYFKMIYQSAKKLNPDFVVQICPCGTNFSFYNLPYVNQTVASDPLSSWQVRLKGKTFKAIVDNKIAYSGDHVELTNRIWDESTQKENIVGKEDFVSTIAVGGVPSTKFTVSGIKQADSTLVLTAEKENIWNKWISFYKDEKLKDAKYVNLYDIAYDKPETHLLKKENEYYYSFFAKDFSGKVELRGLEKGDYKVQDINNDKKLVDLSSDDPYVKINFKSNLLLKVSKIDKGDIKSQSK